MARIPVTYDEDLVSAFVERVHGEADRIFRFAAAVTLNLEDAFACVEEAYARITPDLHGALALHTEQLRLVLMGHCWQIARAAQITADPALQQGVFALFGKLDIEARGVLAAIDVLGVTLADAARLFSMDEVTLLRNLAEARRLFLAAGQRN